MITDRRVLDQQLQDAIYQIEHAQGVVKAIDQDSQQLAAALIDGTQIIITTLQKFRSSCAACCTPPAPRAGSTATEEESSRRRLGRPRSPTPLRRHRRRGALEPDRRDARAS